MNTTLLKAAAVVSGAAKCAHMCVPCKCCKPVLESKERSAAKQQQHIPTLLGVPAKHLHRDCACPLSVAH